MRTDQIRIDRYRGDGSPPTGKPARLHPYLADARLAKAVNMAIVLGKPLLVKGPPGCGKTRLADSIAHELGLGKPHKWYVKSTSRARDGLYTIEMVRRLCDLQISVPPGAVIGTGNARWLSPYIVFGTLGKAIRGGKECVVLIDEIDKADLDFPNDLLRELDEMKFTIDELSPEEESNFADAIERDYAATDSARPIIVITSNDEKELPEPFLRRCLFYYIPFPHEPELLKIVRINTDNLPLKDQLIERAVKRFLAIRESPPPWRKPPGTTELIDWLRILHYWGVSPKQLDPVLKLADLPEWEVLFKNQNDLDRVRETLPELKK